MAKNRTIPFGYCVRNGEIVIDKIESAAVREIFESYNNGKSFKQIAKEQTVPYSEHRTEWLKPNVARVLGNSNYLGNDKFPRIIETKLFEVAQQKRGIIKGKCKRKKPKKDAILEIIPRQDLTPQIMRLENTINRALSQRDFDYEKTKEQIFALAILRYQQIGANC
jgi:hypothetical protein